MHLEDANSIYTYRPLPPTEYVEFFRVPKREQKKGKPVGGGSGGGNELP
ncbi:hypothetical protein JCM15124A_16340 [Prevotella falsenii]